MVPITHAGLKCKALKNDREKPLDISFLGGMDAFKGVDVLFMRWRSLTHGDFQIGTCGCTARILPGCAGTKDTITWDDLQKK